MKTVIIYTIALLTHLRPVISQEPEDSLQTHYEVLPILSYDSDAGYGYGLKAMIVDWLGQKESFDIILFNSTKGERWYRFVASYPDFELRQGTMYPLSIDFMIDYDKWISNSFFGIGADSKFSDREYYTREPLEYSLTIGRGIVKTFVVQSRIRSRSIRNSNFSDTGRLKTLPPYQNSGTARINSISLTTRYDSRISYVFPSSGIVLSGEMEYAPIIFGSNTDYASIRSALQYYQKANGNAVVAVRGVVQSLHGKNLPIQTLLSVGGTHTLRGFPLDRYLDRFAVICNLEYRFPIFWRIGGIVGADAGNVSHSLSQFSLSTWVFNSVGGLRFSMDTFVIRLDVGVSSETTQMYLNFGELF